jgi:hypothetical protein
MCKDLSLHELCLFAAQQRVCSFLHIGALILMEAGGMVLDPCGCPWDIMGRRILGTNAHLGQAVAELLAKCKTSAEEPAAPVWSTNGSQKQH